MTNLDALYQEVILEHNRRPKNYGPMEGADREIRGRNPSCGDSLTLWLRFDGDTVADARFVGEGCAISKASASMMTAAVKGRSRAEAGALFQQVHRMLTGTLPEGERKALGSIQALAGVARFPNRVKCASMAWHTLHEALQADGAGAPPPAQTG